MKIKLLLIIAGCLIVSNALAVQHINLNIKNNSTRTFVYKGSPSSHISVVSSTCTTLKAGESCYLHLYLHYVPKVAIPFYRPSAPMYLHATFSGDGFTVTALLSGKSNSGCNIPWWACQQHKCPPPVCSRVYPHQCLFRHGFGGDQYYAILGIYSNSSWGGQNLSVSSNCNGNEYTMTIE